MSLAGDRISRNRPPLSLKIGKHKCACKEFLFRLLKPRSSIANILASKTSLYEPSDYSILLPRAYVFEPTKIG